MEKQDACYAVVIGGINMDLYGTPETAMIPGDSNPGHVEAVPGGVGRNIAENIVRLGVPVRMITAMGEDANGHFLRKSCEQAGIDLSACMMLPDARTSTYLCLNDEKGNILGAVADMAVYDRMTPDSLEAYRDIIAGAAFVVTDANIPADTLAAAAAMTDAPVFADPVSVKKAGRLAGILSRCTMIKPNAGEAALLTGVLIQSDIDLDRAAQVMLDKGVAYAVISLGSRGVYWNDGKQHGVLPCLPGLIVNTSGCGDAFLAAAAVSCMKGFDIQQMMAYGLAASSVTAKSAGAVSSEISWPVLQEMLKKQTEVS